MEGAAGAAVVPTITSISVTVSQYGQWLEESELLADQAIDSVLAEFTDMLGEAMGISIDTVDREVLCAGSSVQYASTATTRATLGSGMRLNTAELLEARNTLSRNDAKPVVDGFYAVIVHPDGARDLQSDTSYFGTQQYAGPRDSSNAIVRGTLNDYFGMRFFETSNARIFASLGLSGADIYATLVIGAGYYGITELAAQQSKIIYHPPGSSGRNDPLDQVWTIGYKVSHAAVRLNEAFATRIEHTSSRGAMG